MWTRTRKAPGTSKSRIVLCRKRDIKVFSTKPFPADWLKLTVSYIIFLTTSWVLNHTERKFCAKHPSNPHHMPISDHFMIQLYFFFRYWLQDQNNRIRREEDQATDMVRYVTHCLSHAETASSAIQHPECHFIFSLFGLVLDASMIRFNLSWLHCLCTYLSTACIGASK